MCNVTSVSFEAFASEFLSIMNPAYRKFFDASTESGQENIYIFYTKYKKYIEGCVPDHASAMQACIVNSSAQINAISVEANTKLKITWI